MSIAAQTVERFSGEVAFPDFLASEAMFKDHFKPFKRNRREMVRERFDSFPYPIPGLTLTDIHDSFSIGSGDNMDRIKDPTTSHIT